MRRTFIAFAALFTLAGCTAGEASTDALEAPATGGAPAEKPPIARTTVEESIYDLKRPGSTVADGVRVRVAGPGLRVTSASHERKVFVQEAADDGTCESGSAIVAYRAIEVVLAADLAVIPVRGTRVVVDGLVTTRDGRRTLEDAVLTRIDEPVREYRPHCDRDSTALYTYALDAVLVTTAGVTDEDVVPGEDGSVPLATCMGEPIRVGSAIIGREDWTPGWRWVTGIAVYAGARSRLEPRAADDVGSPTGNDACL